MNDTALSLAEAAEQAVVESTLLRALNFKISSIKIVLRSGLPTLKREKLWQLQGELADLYHTKRWVQNLKKERTL